MFRITLIIFVFLHFVFPFFFLTMNHLCSSSSHSVFPHLEEDGSSSKSLCNLKFIQCSLCGAELEPDHTSCHSSPQFREWKQPENAKYKEIQNGHLEVKHHLPLFNQLHRLVGGSHHGSIVCPSCSSALHDFAFVLLQLWHFWMGTLLRAWFDNLLLILPSWFIFLVFVANNTRQPTSSLLVFILLASPVRAQLTEEKWSFYHSSRAHVHRPSCVATEVERLNAMLQKKIGQSILGKVKLQIKPVDWWWINVAGLKLSVK